MDHTPLYPCAYRSTDRKTQCGSPRGGRTWCAPSLEGCRRLDRRLSVGVRLARRTLELERLVIERLDVPGRRALAQVLVGDGDGVADLAEQEFGRRRAG